MSTSSDAVLAEEERRATEVYDRLVRPTLRPEDEGKYVAVAFEASDFEVDPNDSVGARPFTLGKIWTVNDDAK